jgi:arylsulfatase A-like enzyme
MNVAVVVLDALRYDHFREHFDWLSGRQFANAYSTSHWTAPAHASLYTGQYASEVGVHGRSLAFDWEGTTLAEALSAAGYTTRLFTANGQLYRWDGWRRGFTQALGPATVTPIGAERGLDWDRFLHETDTTGPRRYLRAIAESITGSSDTLVSLKRGYRMARNPNWMVSAAELAERVRYTEFGDREFLLVNFVDTHTPYYPPIPYRTSGDPVKVLDTDAFAGAVGEDDLIRRAYDDAVRYLSDIYRELYVDLLDSFDRVITLSDHGELLGEHGMWNHSYGLYPELTHVPLVLDGEGVPGGIVERPVSLLDVHRTIAEWTGIEVESRGRHLLDETTCSDRLVEYHGLLPWHRERFGDLGLSEARYDRLNEPLDGLVASNGFYGYWTHEDGFRSVGTPPTEMDDPAAHLATLAETIPRRSLDGDGNGDADISPGVRTRLEELGYV